jgi:deazaflavin-dependent oxidoreductase (nitroreductase family)
MLPRTVLRIGWAFHRILFRVTGGRVGTERAKDGRLGMLFITTTSRKTGQPRRNPLFYLEDGPNLVVSASNAGAPRDPGWWRNLQADPHATIELAGERTPVLARRAGPDEADRMWPRFIAANPNFRAYREQAGREVALVVLEVTEPGEAERPLGYSAAMRTR